MSVSLLPHRPPFVFVSRVLSCDLGAKSLAAEWTVANGGKRPSELEVVEALGQASCILILSLPEFEGTLPVFAGFEAIRFDSNFGAAVSRGNGGVCDASEVATSAVVSDGGSSAADSGYSGKSAVDSGDGGVSTASALSSGLRGSVDEGTVVIRLDVRLASHRQGKFGSVEAVATTTGPVAAVTEDALRPDSHLHRLASGELKFGILKRAA